MAYINLNGNMSDGWIDELIEEASDYGSDIIENVTGQAKEAIINKAGELLGTKKYNEQKPTTTVPSTQTGAGTIPPTTTTLPTTPATVTPPPTVPPPKDEQSATQVVVSKVKQFPGWGIGAVAGTITYLLSKSIIGGLAVGGGSWLLFDKATK